MLNYQRVPSIWNNDMTRLPTSPHHDTVHFHPGSIPTKPSCRSLQHGIYTFPRKNFWHLLATLTRVPSLFQPVWTTSPDQQYGDTSKSMIPYIWIISSYIYTCYQLQFLHHIFLGEVHHTQRWSQAERAEKSALQMRPRNLEPGRIGIWFQEIPLIFQSDISFQS